MAVVFISPKKRQKMFFIGITVMFLLLLVAVALFVFLSQPQPAEQGVVFYKPKINIDFKVLDSDQFKSLEPFTHMQALFSYTAMTIKGQSVSGTIPAASIEDATKILQGRQLFSIEVKEFQIGRENPFTPYY